ncbi:WxL domain-containing protein [Enterococcus faecalis]|uniref:WxL domain-containing protein n=1 Tax=Enterococcus faecalis TaxID=1351 RepID=UPI00115B6BFF|nr:WxL domain-containing protein [Enterococcus faecalis]
MNQKWQKLLTTALCCSLLISSLNGISVLAETMVVENETTTETGETTASEDTATSDSSLNASQENETANTVASSEPTTEPETSELPQKMIEEPQLPSAEDQTEATADTTTAAVEATQEEPTKRENRAVKTADIPEKTYKMAFIDENGLFIDPAKVTFTADVTKVERKSGTQTKVGTITTSNLGNFKMLTVPKVTLPDDDATEDYGFSGLTNHKITLPGQYSTPKTTPNNFYKGPDTTTFPLAVSRQVTIATGKDFSTYTTGERFNMFTTATPKQFSLRTYSWVPDPQKVQFSAAYSMATTAGENNYLITDDTVYYYVPNRRVSIYYNDMTSTVLPTYPTGYNAALSKTVVESDNFHYKAPKAFPKTYSSGNRHFQFKGWYKGSARPDPKAVKLETTLTPEFDVTYDGKDNVYVFYEELEEKTTTIPEITYSFGFVDEKGALIAPANFGMQTNLTSIMNGIAKQVGTVTGVNSGNLKKLTIPSQQLTYTKTINPAFYGSTNFRLTIPKQYKPPTVTSGPHYTGSSTAYPVATKRMRFVDSTIADIRVETDGKYYSLYPTTTANQYRLYYTYWTEDTTKTRFDSILTSTNTEVSVPNYYTTDDTMYYFLENRRITENFVDENGTKITAPTGFTQGNQLVMNSETYKYTAAKALPKTYQVGEKTYVFKGWYKGKETTTPLKTTTTPSFTPTFDENDDMTAVYQEAVPTAELTVKGSADIVENGTTMDHWEVLLKNTGEAPLTTIKIKPTATWAAGISPPNTIFVLGTGQNAKAYPVTKEQWAAGFSLPLNTPLPAGGQLQMNLLGTAVTGNPGQVLTAEVEVTGNFGSLIAKDTVRIKDLDQEITNPDGDGFISTPTFDFGKLAISGSKQQYGLKKAADYYDNGTRNPYLRLNTSQDNWSLTAQLSQPKSATDSLPTTTRLLLGTAAAASFTDYNQSTETKTPLGKTGTVNLTADNTATAVVANQQFTGSDVYQLDFTFANIKLEVPANQGMSGQQYQAAVTWNLVTGP